MHVIIRKLTGSQYENVLIPISKANTILELRKLIHNKLKIDPEQQMLLFMGKELVNDHLITDYGIQNGYTIQMVVRQHKSPNKSDELSKSSDTSATTTSSSSEKIIEGNNKEITLTSSDYYKVGDQIDVQLVDNGAWYEAEIIGIKKKCVEGEDSSNDNLIFTVKNAPYVMEFESDVKFDDIRPRSFYVYKHSELKKDMVVLANYNIEEPDL
ncbi:unnamed protein product [Callosobruchus maculatus]|uniref:Ubiquitin-like domain-containing protein n=1 Tax=Callosobruchus maculatus TaxID=64391 RepID=A0A653C5L6_CALMS|nr:unnamed protein product [Callosobruchus maculatus]